MTSQPLSPDVLKLDLAAQADKIAARMREILSGTLHRRGLVVAISGGIDSSVSVSLAVRAIGPERVFALILPEQDSSDDSAVRAGILAKHLGIEVLTVNIAPTLDAIGCYRWRDEAVRSVVPQYGAGWRMKIVISGGIAGRINRFKLIAQAPDGAITEAPLPLKPYLQIVAATNFKQRIRKTLEYFHADRLNYAVVGTPNRLEYDQGFFVKHGDGAADVKPIAHLYKSQVYAMARYLGLPERVCAAVPTTDTYSLSQGQDEFYFALPYAQMDLALWALNHDRPASELAAAIGVDEATAEAVYADIRAKRRATRYLHERPQLMEEITELHLQ
jgi:NAD+ synthase